MATWRSRVGESPAWSIGEGEEMSRLSEHRAGRLAGRQGRLGSLGTRAGGEAELITDMNAVRWR